MPSNDRPQSVRVLCLDGGGIKGYTSLLILKRIFRTMRAEGQLDEIPRPCDVFDLIVGTSTGGIIAVMLGRLHMTIDESLEKYEQLGGQIFGKKPYGGKFGKAIKGLTSSAFYDIKILQEEVKRVLDAKGLSRDTEFRETSTPMCKVMLCVTRSEISKPDVLRNYESLHTSAENYHCKIWEAASATAAAPMYFKGVQFNEKGERWCDGGLRRNNPINEALAELSREREWKDKKIGCILSLGTGVTKSLSVSSNLASILKGAVAIMTDSDDTARVFASSELGLELSRSHRYFRFSLPQGMQDLQLDEWKETERMRALTTDYLSHAMNADMLERCAKSLLDPDENLQFEIKSKHSLMPYQPCNHFVERRNYAKTLQDFFRYKRQPAQTFVLWGMGGVGKTQIALKFAQTMRYRLSVFWIRADRFTNFAADYVQILREMDPDSAAEYDSADLHEVLEKTRRKLESTQGEWLLLLDNADDLDAFLGRSASENAIKETPISTFLPREGRLLITTRDRRFQGTVAAAADGMRVDPMSQNEAVDLLLQSIPGYLIRDQDGFTAEAQQLLEELDYLPLAIAQAAANILDQQLTLAEFVSFYQDKKQRMRLMQAPAHDFQSTDPRNASQSVNLTWQISFDTLKERHPLSATLLTYIGCFYWRNIPRALLRWLPQFRDLTDASFIQLSKKPLSLSLMDEVEQQPGFVEYMVHPLIHERILGHLTTAEPHGYLEPLVSLFASAFPFVEQRSDSQWQLAVYLSPHAIQILELCVEHGFHSKSLSILVLRLSRFFGTSNRFAAAVDLAEKAMVWGVEAWDSDPHMTVTFWINVCNQYSNASRYKEAEQQARGALQWLDSESVRSVLGEQMYASYKMRVQAQLSTSLTSSTDRGGHHEREQLERAQLATRLMDEWSHEGLITRHNVAHALFHQGKIEEAEIINKELVAFAKRCQILRICVEKFASGVVDIADLSLAEPAISEPYNEMFGIHQRVFEESLEHLGIEDIDTWKAVNNLVHVLAQSYLWAESRRVLMLVLPAGTEAKVKAEGKFAVTLRDVTSSVESNLDFIEGAGVSDSGTGEEFRLVLQNWLVSTGLSERSWMERDHKGLNGVAVGHQQRRRFEQAEKAHLRAIELCLEEGIKVPSLYRYNLMLAVARQGRMADALALRDAHREDVVGDEHVFGSLEMAMAKDARNAELYRQARALADSGQLSKDGEWWRANKRALQRAELRYGRIENLHPTASKDWNSGLKGDKGGLSSTLKKIKLRKIGIQDS